MIAELQQRIADLSRRRPSENDAEVEDHGDYTEQDNTDERSRYEINRDARVAAKEFLECLSDYDCSEWNPEEGRHLIKGIIKYKENPSLLLSLVRVVESYIYIPEPSQN